MDNIKFLDEGLDPGEWGKYEYYKDKLKKKKIEIIQRIWAEKKAEKSQYKEMGYERLGERLRYSKSQIENFLKGKTAIPEEKFEEWYKVLGIKNVDLRCELEEYIQRLILESQDSVKFYNSEEEYKKSIDNQLAMLNREDDLEIDECTQEEQLKIMKEWYVEMDFRSCFMLDNYYYLYEESMIPEKAQKFMQNYSLMKEEDKSSFRKFMEHISSPVGGIHKQREQFIKFRKLTQLVGWEKSKVEKQIKDDLKQVGREKSYTKRDFELVRREEHWESFRNKIKKSPYMMGDYFYSMMRILVRMDEDMWEVLAIYLMLGDENPDTFSINQKFISHLVIDTEEENREGRK